MRTRLVAAGAALTLLAGCSAGPASRRLPDFALINQSGQVVRAEDLRGRAAVISFIFTTCHDVCPLVTAQLARTQADARAAGLGAAVRFVSITVDPNTDTPAVLQRYAARFEADMRTWDFLTGPPDEVARVLRAMRVFAEVEGGRLGHATVVLLVSPRGEVVQRYTDVDRLHVRILDGLRRLEARGRGYNPGDRQDHPGIGGRHGRS